MLKPGERMLRVVHSNIGLEKLYKRRLLALIDKMHDSILYWLRVSYKANTPEMSADATPAVQLHKTIRRLASRWLGNWRKLSPKLAKAFVEENAALVDNTLKSSVATQGLAIKFKLTPAMNDVLQATVKANVSLIRSIPQKYLQDVEGAVMRSVQAGRDIESLFKELQHTYNLTKDRAKLIAFDQNNKATSALTRVRQLELGVTKAIWVHTGIGKKPRPEHVHWGKEQRRYDISKGMYDHNEGRYIFPGELINCHCLSRPVIAGFA